MIGGWPFDAGDFLNGSFFKPGELGTRNKKLLVTLFGTSEASTSEMDVPSIASLLVMMLNQSK